MERSIRELLAAADHPEAVEFPPDFDWNGIQRRVRSLKAPLEAAARRPFVLDDNFQDASCFADLSIQRSAGDNVIETVFAFRFSNFGNLFTTWSHCPSECLDDDLVRRLIVLVQREGFHYVPPAAVNEPYDGVNSKFRNDTWWGRYFDWI